MEQQKITTDSLNYEAFYFKNKEQAYTLLRAFGHKLLAFSQEFQLYRKYRDLHFSEKESPLTLNHLHAQKSPKKLLSAYETLFISLIQLFELKVQDNPNIEETRRANKCYSFLQSEFKKAVWHLPKETKLIYEELINGLGLYYIFSIAEKHTKDAFSNDNPILQYYINSGPFLKLLKDSWAITENASALNMSMIVGIIEDHNGNIQSNIAVQQPGKYVKRVHKICYDDIFDIEQNMFEFTHTKSNVKVKLNAFSSRRHQEAEMFLTILENEPEILEKQYEALLKQKKLIDQMLQPSNTNFSNRFFLKQLERAKSTFLFRIKPQETEGFSKSKLASVMVFFDEREKLNDTFLENKKIKTKNRAQAKELKLPDHKHLEIFRMLCNINISSLIPSITPEHTHFCPVSFFAKKIGMKTAHDYLLYGALCTLEEMLEEYKQELKVIESTQESTKEKINFLDHLSKKLEKLEEQCRENAVKFSATEIIQAMSFFNIQTKPAKGDHMKLLPKQLKGKQKGRLPEVDIGRGDNFYIIFIENMCTALDIPLQYFFAITKGETSPFALNSEEKQYIKKSYIE